MNEKRFTTVELPKPNKWGIWYDGAYLSTYQVCILLNEYVDVKKENEQLKQELFESEKEWYECHYADNPVRIDSKLEALKEEFKERFGRDFE